MSEFRLEVGKKYVDRRGRVYGPLFKTEEFFGECPGNRAWYGRGNICVGDTRPMDLIAEYVEPSPVEYRLLQDGETFKDGDEWKANGGWTSSGVSVGKKFSSSLYVPHRRKIEPPAPVYQPENNDEWVELSDPEHILRRDVDQYYDSDLRKWCPVIVSAGHRIKECSSRREFRCRLKDLPQLPPVPVKSPDDWLRYDYKGTQVTCQRKALDPAKPLPTHERYDKHSCKWIPVYTPATTPVRLWVSERITYESGDWPVRCGAEPPSGLGSWAEIFPSPDGFFVKKSS